MMVGFQICKKWRELFCGSKADYANMSVFDVDNYDMNQLYDILENQIYQCTTKDQMNGDK